MLRLKFFKVVPSKPKSLRLTANNSLTYIENLKVNGRVAMT